LKTNQLELEAIQKNIRRYVGEGRSISDEFITERRLEALGELDHENDSRQVKQQVEKEGFIVREGFLSQELVERMIDALMRIDQARSIRQKGGIFAVRNLLDVCPEVRILAESRIVRQYVEPILGDDFLPVRGILFDKIPGANWKVPWHQDVTIAVRGRIDVDGVLERIVSVRFHLDDCGAENGALRVIAGSHLMGKIPEDQIDRLRRNAIEQVCAVRTGGALFMRPLLLHASSQSVLPDHRRVIHIDFAGVSLPGGLRWFSEQ
jgi:ectoine hydroxylase-related dioxygenase (phytanoyl-CoA dioxygenase family)